MGYFSRLIERFFFRKLKLGPKLLIVLANLLVRR